MFFPRLTRRDDYPVKANGGFYAYSRYKAEVAEDCQYRCVYCDAKADEVGGHEAMQLDHFRPESFPEFESLINDPHNLHYACGRCNLWKSSYWPARGSNATHNGNEGFIDPFTEDRHTYFRVDADDGSIIPLRPPSAYMIRLLHLDREFLRKTRELRILKDKWRNHVALLRQRVCAGEVVDPKELERTLGAIECLLA